ncbi:hypothetical protein LPB140_03600 [Sphingorhabdus lutea]|uniref:Uncharacterized protein n=1 Tax=Sphingorhabdus lutea TaxID=1913578 RepID=A0A1L3JA99_9SPHN|nr:hypothetical protein [Sphingorhabdus lutea]APG62051.1 hypothetical protein LPB140_03600 [Sphingorhabdus lutea]
MSSLIKPKYPLLMMNDYYIINFDQPLPWHKTLFIDHYYGYLSITVSVKGFKSGKFIKNAYVIDVHCRKFPVLGVKKLRQYRKLLTKLGLNSLPKYYIEYIYGDPIQLTFKEVREEIFNLVVSRRWYGPKNYRKYIASFRNMEELIDGISFHGRWQF